MKKYLTTARKVTSDQWPVIRVICLAAIFCLLTPVHVFADNINIIDHQLKTSKPLPVNVVSAAAVAGASTAAKQDTGNTSLASIDSKTPTLVGGRQPVDGSGVTQPVSAAALPLPTGAATSALQPALVSGRTPVDGSGVTQPVSAAALPLPTGAAKAVGTPNYANGQVTLSTAAGTVKASNATRRSISITNLDPGITVYIGGATVTSANGERLLPGQSKVINAVGLIQGIAVSGTPIVSYWEEYD
jgi:hypothetical protein